MLDGSIKDGEKQSLSFGAATTEVFSQMKNHDMKLAVRLLRDLINPMGGPANMRSGLLSSNPVLREKVVILEVHLRGHCFVKSM